MRVRLPLTLVGSLALLVAGCGTQAHAQGRHEVPASHVVHRVGGVFAELHWLVAASGLKKIAAVTSPEFVKSYFDSPRTTIITSTHVPSAYANWRAAFAVDARSVGEVRQDVSVFSGQKFVLFDVEHWSFTPVSEQLNPLRAASAAAQIARTAGLSVISAPAVDLAEVIKPGMNIWKGYLASGVVGAFSRYSVALDIQAQGLEARPLAYELFVNEAATQAREENPNVRIYAGISTNPSGQQVSVRTILQDVEGTRSEVYGYWLNVPSGGPSCPRCGVARPQVGVSLLSRLAKLKVG